MTFKVKTYPDLTKDELYALLQLRAEVFVVEQVCPYQDVDGKDQKALHILGYLGEILVAYARIFKAGDYFDRSSIGRVVVKAKVRQKEYGKQLMKISFSAVEEFYKTKEIEISAQTYLGRFYKELGFESTGKSYLEDGIPHIKMIKT